MAGKVSANLDNRRELPPFSRNRLRKHNLRKSKKERGTERCQIRLRPGQVPKTCTKGLHECGNPRQGCVVGGKAIGDARVTGVYLKHREECRGTRAWENDIGSNLLDKLLDRKGEKTLRERTVENERTSEDEGDPYRNNKTSCSSLRAGTKIDHKEGGGKEREEPE